MRNWCAAVVRFIEREDGPTAVEYAVMLALIIVVCLAAITTLGQNANSTFNNTALNSAVNRRHRELVSDLIRTNFFQEYSAMRKFTEAVVNFVKREDGPTAVEYAVMLALIIVVCLAAITTLGQNANTTFTTVGSKIGSASS